MRVRDRIRLHRKCRGSNGCVVHREHWLLLSGPKEINFHLKNPVGTSLLTGPSEVPAKRPQDMTSAWTARGTLWAELGSTQLFVPGHIQRPMRVWDEQGFFLIWNISTWKQNQSALGSISWIRSQVRFSKALQYVMAMARDALPVQGPKVNKHSPDSPGHSLLRQTSRCTLIIPWDKPVHTCHTTWQSGTHLGNGCKEKKKQKLGVSSRGRRCWFWPVKSGSFLRRGGNWAGPP